MGESSTRKVVAVRVFLSFYYPLISILTLHILTKYCATEMKGFNWFPKILNFWILLLDSKSVNTLMTSFWEGKVVAVRVFFLSFYYPLISILTLHILTTYCATEMKGFPQHPLDGSFSIFFLSVLMFSLLITMGRNSFCCLFVFVDAFKKTLFKTSILFQLQSQRWKDFVLIKLWLYNLHLYFVTHSRSLWKVLTFLLQRTHQIHFCKNQNTL